MKIALVTDEKSLSIDHDMPILLAECARRGVSADVCSWRDSGVDWSVYNLVIPRSPWTYIDHLAEFLGWCHAVEAITTLVNPASVAEWGLRKTYLKDLGNRGIPIPPTFILEEYTAETARDASSFIVEHGDSTSFVVKPCIGAYSAGVRRMESDKPKEILRYVQQLVSAGIGALMQPYLDSIDLLGEINLIYFDGSYSHAIAKRPMLLSDGTVHVPTLDMRETAIPTDAEKKVAELVLSAAVDHLRLSSPLLYGRVDLVRDDRGRPQVLEMDICEPSLNLGFNSGAATLFLDAILLRLRASDGSTTFSGELRAVEKLRIER
ncbi:ATP-grasp domain-containing protein [Mycobacterium sp. BMJ-28]